MFDAQDWRRTHDWKDGDYTAGLTAAMMAAQWGRTDCLTALVEGKADLDVKVRGVMTHGRVALLVNDLIDR